MFSNFDYARYEHLFAQVQLVLFMLGMGMTLSVRDFTAVLARPRSLIVAGIGQILLLPLFAYGLTQIIPVDPGIGVGLVLVAAMPGGVLSKLFTFFGRGNVALSITLSVATTLAAIITVPLQLRWLASDFIPADFVMPIADIIRELSLYLLLPLAVGMFLGRVLPKHQRLVSKIFIRLGLVVVVAMVTFSLGQGRIKPGAYGWKVPLLLIFFCLAGMQINMALFRIFGWPRADRLAAGIEVTMRNMNLALLLKPILFPLTDPNVAPLADAVLFVILYYAGVAMGCGIPLALNHRRLSKREL